MICREASTETSTEHVIHGIPRNWDQSRQKYGYTPSWLTWASSSLPRGLWLGLAPRDHSPHCSYKNPVSKWILSMFPWPIPHWQRVRFWCLKLYKALHDLSPWPLCLIPFHSPPPQPTQPSHPRLLSITPSTFLGPSAQGLLITEHFPGPRYTPLSHQSLSPEHSSQPGIRFSLCDNALSSCSFIVCLALRRILFYFFFFFYSCFSTQKNYALRNKRIHFGYKIF